jgi:hypothetical protein
LKPGGALKPGDTVFQAMGRGTRANRLVMSIQGNGAQQFITEEDFQFHARILS